MSVILKCLARMLFRNKPRLNYFACDNKGERQFFFYRL